MAHVRKQIRDAAKTALTGLVTTRDAVYSDRAYTIPAAPALQVFFTRETAELVTMGSDPTQERDAILTVIGWAEGSGLDDTLDLIASEVEVAINGATAVDALTNGAPEYEGADIDVAEGDSRTGAITMRWRVRYLTASSTPDTAL